MGITAALAAKLVKEIFAQMLAVPQGSTDARTTT
jgi:hypothetical protein